VVLPRDVITHGVGVIVTISSLQTHPSPLNTVIGYTVFSVMRLLAPVTGLAGMELLPNSSVLVDFSITKKLMHVTGHPMSEAARSTHSVPRILMPTYPSAPLVKDTGPAKEDILVSNVAQLLLFLTNSPADVWLLLLKIVKLQQLQKHLLKKDRHLMDQVSHVVTSRVVVGHRLVPNLVPNLSVKTFRPGL